MRKGWFRIPGVQDGERSFEEQMKGVQPALDECRGKTVLDLGCAEGLFSLEFARAGAARVYAFDANEDSIAVARSLLDQADDAARKAVCFKVENLNLVIEEELASREVWGYDIVLALAILHKARDPGRATRFVARSTLKRLVIRLPLGSKGLIASKWDGRAQCDTAAVLSEEGLRLVETLPGARGELVQHWVR